MPKNLEIDTSEPLYVVRVSANYKAPTVKGKRPADKWGTPLPILNIVAFPNDEERKKVWTFYGDEEFTLTKEEYLEACFQKVPKNIDKSGAIPHPFLVVKEVS